MATATTHTRITNGDGEWIGIRPRVVTPQLIETQMQRGRDAFSRGERRIALDTIYELAGWDQAANVVDALIDEVYGKPNLGVEDSAGLMDYYGDDGIEDDYAWIASGC